MFQKNKPETGNLLIAEPFLQEVYFKRSVILLAEHNESGSLGFIMNKPLDIKITNVAKDFPPFSGNLFYGGPVRNDLLFFVHTLGEQIEDSIPIIKGLFWGGKTEVVKESIKSGLINEDNIKFFVGHSGWSEGQLEEELKENAWFMGKFDTDFIMNTEPRMLWRKTLINMGKEFAQYANYPENPSYN
ncbi:MAG: YqgE/AlgH family protein [Bacteroidota bacterium]|nr:YqgE/AlgH family protein [Bacteroidota bacterium]